MMAHADETIEMIWETYHISLRWSESKWEEIEEQEKKFEAENVDALVKSIILQILLVFRWQEMSVAEHHC